MLHFCLIDNFYIRETEICPVCLINGHIIKTHKQKKLQFELISLNIFPCSFVFSFHYLDKNSQTGFSLPKSCLRHFRCFFVLLLTAQWKLTWSQEKVGICRTWTYSCSLFLFPSRPPALLASLSPRILMRWAGCSLEFSSWSYSLKDFPLSQRLRILYAKILASLQTMPQDAAYRKYTEPLVNERLDHVKTVSRPSSPRHSAIIQFKDEALICFLLTGARCCEAREENKRWTDWRSHLPGRKQE